MQGKLKERPSFEHFKSCLKAAIREVAGFDAEDSHRWAGIGDEGKRMGVLLSLKRSLEAEYGVELPVDNMPHADAAIESVAVQLHHVYSTVYLMERINQKIIARRQS